MNPTDRMLAWAQIWLSILFIVGTFAIIGCYELGYAKFTPDQAKDFNRNMDWLTMACGVIVYFWFQRARQGGMPDPSNVVTQTHTLPDGTKTTITSPVNAPTTNVPILATSSTSSSQGEHSTTKTDVISPQGTTNAQTLTITPAAPPI